jgi:hypothetical protein
LASFPQGFPVFGIIIVEREQLGEFRQLGRDFGGNQGMGLGKTRNVRMCDAALHWEILPSFEA